MYKIYVREDNSVLVSNKQRIMQRSSLVDTVQILVPKLYNDLDMTEFSCMMEYILPCSKEYKVEVLEKSEELYNECIQYFIPMDSELTSEPGDIEIQFTFAKRDENGEISKTDMIRKTGKSMITIVPISKWSDILVNFDDETGKPYPVDILDKKLLEINAKSGDINIDDDNLPEDLPISI